jgi:hypothetical protein
MTITITSQISQSSDDGIQTQLGSITLNGATLPANTTLSWIALRFQGVTIPKGYIIESASLVVNVVSATADDPDFNIYAQKSASPTTLTVSPAGNISNNVLRPRTTAFVNWTATGIGTGLKSPGSLSTIIQEVVTSVGINGSVILLLDGLDAVNFEITAWDGTPALAATLTITYSIPTPDQTTLASPLSFYLITEKLPTVFTGLTSAVPSDVTVIGDGGQTGSFGAPLPGMTAIFDNDDQKAVRVRTFALGATGTFVLGVGENDDVTPYVLDNEAVTIKAQFRLWPIYPRVVQAGEDAEIFIDFNTAYTDQTRLWKPVAVAGPPAVVEYNGATAQAQFVGDRSFALAPGATLSAYLWTAPGSVEGSSSSQGTEVSPVTFTYTAPGQKLVYLKVTDSNGKSATNYTWVFVVDPSDPTQVAYLDFDEFNDNFDYEQGGGACSFTVHGGATVADFPNECLVIQASRPTTPGQTTPTNSWPFRENINFWGFILGDTVRQNPTQGDVTFQAATIDTLMKNLTVFPVSLTTRNNPVNWTEAYHLTANRAASYLWHYYSTLSLMAPIRPISYTAFIWRQDFGPSDLFSQLNNELMACLWGKVVVNHQGVVHHEIDYNLMLSSERANVTTRKILHKGLWVDDVGIEERMTYSQPVNTVKMSGVLYLGGELVAVCPSFSEAPGNAPKAYGRELNYDRLIITSQGDLNTRCGLALAKAVPKYSGFTMRFINDGSFTIAPQELFPAIIEANDNNRGLSLSKNLIPRRISRRYNHPLGLIEYDVSFEPETTGPPGVTVDLPCGPPAQDAPEDDPPEPPDEGTGEPNALALANEATSFYFGTSGGEWERRVNGLTTLQFADMIEDPWTYFKQGQGIDNIILWGCGSNFLSQSKNSGKLWGDRTVYLDAAPNSWGDSAAPSFTGTLVKQIVGDFFRQDTFYIMLQSVDAGNYRGWLYHTVDDGFNFTPYALTGSSQCLPIRMDLDKQDGSILYLTTWESGAIKLRKYGVTGTGLTLSSTATLVTGTTSEDVLDKAAIAYPLTPLGNKSLLYIYGRLTNPSGLSGTIAIMKSSNAGSSYSSVINNWGDDHCGALQVSRDNGGARALWAVKQNG